MLPVPASLSDGTDLDLKGLGFLSEVELENFCHSTGFKVGPTCSLARGYSAFLGDGVEFSDATSGENELGSFGGEGQGNGSANSRRGTRHPNNLSLECCVHSFGLAGRRKT